MIKSEYNNKKSQFQQQTLHSLDKMYPHFQRKNSHCQVQAINTLQSIFPSISLPQFSRQSSVWEVLQKSAKNLPRPGLSDITFTISNMKTVVDSQELKIQKNMIEIQKCQQIIMSEKKPSFNSNYKFSQQSTGLKRVHRHRDQNQQESMQEEENHYERFQITKRNQFFSEPEQIDYFEQSHHSQIRHNTFDDEEDVKKYLSFDF